MILLLVIPGPSPVLVLIFKIVMTRGKRLLVLSCGKNSKFEIQKILLPSSIIHTIENLHWVLLVNLQHSP